MFKFIIVVLINMLCFFQSEAQNAKVFGGEDLTEADYGLGKSMGISIFGNGLIGMPFRFCLKNQNQFEVVPAYTGKAEYYLDGNGDPVFDKYFHGLNITAGYNLFLGSKYKERKQKIRKNYFSFKGGIEFSNTTWVNAAFTWHREGFFLDESNMSRGLDLGVLIQRPLDNRSFIDFIGSTSQTSANIFLRFDWNWFRSEK